jgi:hypothetical protein
VESVRRPSELTGPPARAPWQSARQQAQELRSTYLEVAGRRDLASNALHGVPVADRARPMSGLHKQVLFGIWALLLIPLIAPVLKQSPEQNVLADSPSTATTAFRDATASPDFTGIFATNQQPWPGFALVFLNGNVVGVTPEWLSDLSHASKLGCGRQTSARIRRPKHRLFECLRCVGSFLDRNFDTAREEAPSWRPPLDRG